jgi:hypothetical protein
VNLPSERSPQVEDLLALERERFIAQFERVAVARRAERPWSGGWSAAEVVEHVSRVEAGIARMIGASATMPKTATPEELAAAAITEEKVRIVRDHSVKAQAPERTHPQGELNADTVLPQLTRSREALLAAFHGADPAVLDGITFLHPFVGPLTLRAWVELIAHHDARHRQQIAELAASMS